MRRNNRIQMKVFGGAFRRRCAAQGSAFRHMSNHHGPNQAVASAVAAEGCEDCKEEVGGPFQVQ